MRHMHSCNHTFPYWSVTPPTHCPCCGACLHPVVVSPYQYPPNYWPPYRPPYYTVTSTTSTHVQGGTLMNAVTA